MRESLNLHHAYYMQFVNDSIKYAVIRLCKGRRWYDIPLVEWDNLDCIVRGNQSADKARTLIDTYNYDGLPKGRFYWSLSDSVCVAKNCAIALFGDKPVKD
jgi:hypothetical protein